MSAVTKLTKAAQRALELRLPSVEVSEKEERLAFAAWANLHYHPAPCREMCPPSEHPWDLTDDTFPDTQTVFSPSCCLLPPISNTNASLCSVSRIRKNQKPDQHLLLEHHLLQNLCAIHIMYFKHWGKHISGRHFGPTLPWEERSFWYLCKRDIPHKRRGYNLR